MKFKNKEDYFAINTILRNSGVTKAGGKAITASDLNSATSQNPLRIQDTAKFFKAKTSGGNNLIEFKLAAKYRNSNQEIQSTDLALNSTEYIKKYDNNNTGLPTGNTYQIINTDVSHSKLYWGADGSEDANKLIFEIPIELPEQVDTQEIKSFKVSVAGMNRKYIEEHTEKLDGNYMCKGITYTLKDENGRKTAEVVRADKENIEANTIIPDYVKDTQGNIYAVTSIAAGNNGSNGVFQNCSQLKSVVIGNNVKSISNTAFYGCGNLISVTIGNDVKSIDKYAFQDCKKLTNVTIGNSVEVIGGCAFSGCASDSSGLAKITIPNSVTNINEYAFNNCKKLTNITIESVDLSFVNGTAFNQVPSDGTIYIPDSKINDDSYKNLLTNNGNNVLKGWQFKLLSEKPAE